MLLRRYQLFIGENTSINAQLANPIIGKSDDKSKASVRDVSPEKFFKVVDNQFEGTIKFNKEGKGSKTQEQTLKVYNPDDKFIDLAKGGNVVVLKAGFNADTELPLIFASDIKSSYVVQDGVDKVLCITCVDAYQARKRIEYVKTFQKNVTYSEVIEDMISAMASKGVSLGKFTKSKKANSQVNSSKPYLGLITKSLDKVCAESEHRWYIASGLLFVEPIEQERSTIEAFEIFERMVVGTVEPFEDLSNKSQKEQSTRTRGVKFKILLNGNASIKDGVEIKFGDFAGFYLITSVSHSMSYEGNSWFTTIEARG